MEAGARVLVNTCAGVTEGEQVLVVTDRRLLSIARSIDSAATAAGAESSIVISPSRAIDNEEPVLPVSNAMMAAHVLFLPVTHALAHTRACRRAIEHGARVVSMSAFTDGMMRSGGLFADFHERKPTCDRIARMITDARRIRVVSEAGTDLTMDVTGRRGNSHCCLVRAPGFTAVPNIEANTSPVEGTSNGVFVVDGSIPYYGVGIVREPVRFTIRDGYVRSIEGGEQAAFLRDLLAAQNDECVYNVAQFAFGLNPECRDFTGEMLNDEGVDGTIHIGIGTSSNLGGNVQAKTHFDAIIRAPTVWLDDIKVVEYGNVLVEAVTAADHR